jgi:hypothetical protein
MIFFQKKFGSNQGLTAFGEPNESKKSENFISVTGELGLLTPT